MLSAKENVWKLYHHEMPEYLPIMGQGIVNNVPINGFHERSAGKNGGLDWFGVHWSWPEGEPAPFPGPEFILEDICDWRDMVKFPDLDAWDWEEAARVDRIPEFDRENNLMYQIIHNGIFERLHTLMGVEDALCSLLLEPEEVAAFFDKMADYKCRLIDKLAEYYKPDIICYHDDWGTQNNLFFSAEVWRSLIKEPTKRIIDHVHSKGMLFELHSCGKIQSLVPEIVDDLKVDALNIMDINDIPALKKITGSKVVYDVYLNTQKLDVLDSVGKLTEETLRKSVREELTANGQGGCYIPTLMLVRPEWTEIIMDEYEKCKYSLYQPGK